MSTPTTATATLPPYHPHHYSAYSHHQPYQATSSYPHSRLPPPVYNAASFVANNSHQAQLSAAPSTNGSRAAHAENGVSVASRGEAAVNYSNATISTATMAGPPGSAHTSQGEESTGSSKRRKRSREPDWGTFYRNGLPKEIIVIDDSPEPSGSVGNGPTKVNGTTATTAGNSGRHAAKRRKRDDGGASTAAASISSRAVHYDPVYHASRNNHQSDAYQSQQHSQHHHPSHGNHTPGSGSTTSTDRTTTGLHTTAATSLSSNGQHPQQHQPQFDYEVPAQAGQKRKRTTRQTIANEAKRREVENLGDAYASYMPPPNPPRKATDVTVKRINDNSYNPAIQCDDEDGHYIVIPESKLTENYQIVKLLGQGTFGKVVQAYDRRRSKLVAVKIIRSVQKYRDASKIELRVLQTLKANDENNRNRCIHLRDCFDFRNHICIVMDLLGQSVFDFLKGNSFVPFPNSQIQSFARQLFTSVAFLHDLNLIHTDLKPENILLCDGAYQTFTYNRKIPSSSQTISRTAAQRRVLLDTEIRLIDFGSATFQDEYHSSVVSTRHYRAPEIILGLGWSYPCDIWSIGCILVEFYTGDALFQTHDNLEHLAMMEAVCDAKIDPSLVQAVNKTAGRNGGNPAAKYFKRGKLDYPTAETTKGSRRYVKAMKHLASFIPTHTTFLRNFLDLLKQIFVYDPAKRITAKEALQHPWFKEPAQADDGTEAAKIRLERLRQEQELSASRSASSAVQP